MKRYIKLVVCMLVALLAFEGTYAQKKAKAPTTMRFMDWNIADGMWFDQFNNYDRFVLWMQAQHIDVFAVCEGATHWDKDKKNIAKNDSVRYLPSRWGELAKRWGHEYTAIGAYQDNYPVVLTSKYPIEVIQQIGGDKVSHGALHAKVNGINIVIIHLWPQQWHKSDKTRTKGSGGDKYRVEEMNYILDQTIRNPKYANEAHWIMTGDFNSRSPIDKPFYDVIFKKKPRVFNYDVHNLVRSVYPHDAIAEKNPDGLQSSTRGKSSRIDFIYCTKSIFSGIVKSYTIRDDFVRTSSDHCALVIEFKKPKK